MDIHDLKLHEATIIKQSGEGYQTEWKVTRVPSGWIYQENNERITNPSTLFVPFFDSPNKEQ